MSTVDLPDLWHHATQDEKDAILFLKELELSGMGVRVTPTAMVVLGDAPKKTPIILNQESVRNYQLGLRQAGLGLWMLHMTGRERHYKTWRGVENAIRRWMKDPRKFFTIAMRDWHWYGSDLEERSS